MTKKPCDCVGLCTGQDRKDENIACRLSSTLDAIPAWVCVCVDRTSRSDVLVFWGPDRKGYTHDLNKAGLYDTVESEEICEGGRHVRFLFAQLRNSAAAQIRIDRDQSNYHDKVSEANSGNSNPSPVSEED